MSECRALSLPEKADYVIVIEEYSIRSNQGTVDSLQVMDYDIVGEVQQI